MDARHFDALTKRLGSRRTALGGLLAGVLLPLETIARGKHKKGTQRQRKDRGQRKEQQRTAAQAEPCWRVGAVSPRRAPTSASATWPVTPLLPASTALAATSPGPTCGEPISVART